MELWHVGLGVLTGLIIFMFGLDNFRRDIQLIAGEKFRLWLSKATKNRVQGTLLGAAVAALAQSSTATTVITVSLVSTGMISFAQSLGIILGANIGTTITPQFVAWNLTAIAPLLIAGGFLLSLRSHYKYLGQGIFYLGLIFFGLNLISGALVSVKDDPTIVSLFGQLSNCMLRW